jgi:ubiquitin-protein ligase
MGGNSSTSSSSSSASNSSSISLAKPKMSKEEENALDKEFIKLKNSKIVPVVKCEYVNNDKKHWKVVFEGSKRSPYENGFFILEFLFNNGVFPQKGPEAKFITKMFHPNVADNGHVCINLLNYWDPKMSIEKVLYGILEILDNPIATGGYTNKARELLEKDVEGFFKKVEEYTYTYAMNSF